MFKTLDDAWFWDMYLMLTWGGGGQNALFKLATNQYLWLLMMLDFDDWFWHLILMLDFDAWFWHLILMLNFDTLFWCLILMLDNSWWLILNYHYRWIDKRTDNTNPICLEHQLLIFGSPRDGYEMGMVK